MAAEKTKLPEGWAETRLKEIICLRNEKIEPRGMEAKAYLSLEHIESGTNRIVNCGSSQEVKSTKTIFYSGDVLYGKLRPYLNKVCQPQFDGVCSTDILVFGPSPAIESSFLMRFLSRRETIEYANMHSKGINLPRVSANQLGELELTLPPLNEQERIVARIEELQARSRRAREVLESIPDLLEQLRQSILTAAFRGDLTRKWREQNPNVEPASELLKRIRAERRKRWEASELEKLKARGLTGDPLDAEFAKRRKQYQEPEPVDTTDLPELPDTWCWASLEVITDPVRVVRYGIIKPGPHVSDGIPYVRVSEMREGYIDLAALRRCGKERAAMFSGASLIGGDILVSKDGTIGKVAIVPPELEGGNITQHMMRVCPLPGIDENYLANIIRSPFTQNWITGEIRGIALRGINVEDFRRLPIPIASSAEQDEINKLAFHSLGSLKSTEAVLRQSHTELHTLDQAIFSKAFRGQLAPQDSSDEPASVLLARIRQEKARQADDQKSNGRRRGK
jgi:type I restriction enzyme, S subunit